MQDCLDALAYVKANAASWGLDPARMIMYGESAGGHLATITAYQSNDPAVKGVVNIYGPSEIEYYWNNLRGGFPDPYIIMAVKNATTSANLRAISCSTYITSTSPPIVSFQGTWDTIVPYQLNVEFHRKLNEANVPNSLFLIPHYQHTMCESFSWYKYNF